MEKYSIEYEALVYNMPVCDEFSFFNHTFHINIVTDDMADFIFNKNNALMANYLFSCCCINDEKGNTVYISLTNDITIEEMLDDIKSNLTQDIIFKKVSASIQNFEQYMLFITNAHIFVPVVNIKVYSEEKKKVFESVHILYRPITYRKWLEHGKLNLNKRFSMGINKEMFDKFLADKKHIRYKRAFDYYIKSFYEYDHSVAFCLLCSALDSITGKSKANLTKDRLAKYSSVLLCEPLNIEKNKQRLRELYKLRSAFTHGKGSNISPEDEFELREYVRKLLLAYFTLLIESKCKYEYELLQILDKIHDDPSQYIVLARLTYTFVSVINEHEQREEGIFNMSDLSKAKMLLSKYFEAVAPTILKINTNINDEKE